MGFQTLPRSFTGHSFENLEPRTLLDGVTGFVSHAYTTPTALYIEVKYSADAPVVVPTLGDDDIRVTRTGGQPFNVLAKLVGTPAYHWDGGLRALYKVDAPDPQNGQWRFGTDNGAYVVSLEAGSVATTSGATSAAADLRTLNLWFNTPIVERTLDPLAVHGVGYPMTPLPAGMSSMDEAQVVLGYRMPTLSTPIRSVQITLTGPNGYSHTTTAAPSLDIFSTADGTALARWVVRFPVPKSSSDTSANGTWDYSDAGTYHMSVRFAPTPGDPTPSVLLERDYVVTSAAPRGEIGSIAVNDDHMLVTMRYTAPGGINLATINDGDIKVSIPGAGVAIGTLVEHTVDDQGAVTAMYRVQAPSAGWVSVPTGKVVVRTTLSSVLASNGVPLAFALNREVDVSSAGRVTGVVTDSYSTAMKLVVVVRYSSDQAVDAASLGDDDVRLTGPFNYSKLGRLVQVLPQVNGSVIAVYHFTSNSISGMWDFHVDNGMYVATLAAGTVHEVGGGGANNEAALRTYHLVFQNPYVELREAMVPWFGNATPDAAYDNTDAARFVLRYTTIDWRPLTSHNLSARMTGPNGFVAELIPNRSPPPYRSVPTGTESDVVFMFSPPGGGWDSTDNGRYTITVYLNQGSPWSLPPNYMPPEVIVVRDIDVNIATPHAEVVSTAVTSSAMLVTVRYQSPSGINLSTIGDGDVGLILRNTSQFSFFGSNTWTVIGTLVGSPTVGQGGSVTATYRIGSVFGGPWQAYQFASVVVMPQQVSNGAGYFIGAPVIHAFTMPAAQPDIVNIGSLAISRSNWDIEVAFRNPGNLIDTSSIRAQNLIVTAPEGRTTRVSVVSVSVGLDGTLRARYRIMPQVGTLRLFDGPYTLVLAANSVSQGPAGYLAGQSLGTFSMIF